MILNGLLIYMLIGTLLGLAATVKGGGKPGFPSYLLCVTLWPLILLILLADLFEKGGRGR